MSSIMVARGRHWAGNAAKAIGVAALANIALHAIKYHGDIDKLSGPIVGSLMWLPLGWLIAFGAGFAFEAISQNVLGNDASPWESPRRSAQYERAPLSLGAIAAIMVAACLVAALSWGAYLASTGRLLIAVDGSPMVGSGPNLATVAPSAALPAPVRQIEQTQTRERWFIVSNGQVLRGTPEPNEDTCETARRSFVWNEEEMAQKTIMAMANEPRMYAYPKIQEMSARVEKARAAYCARF